MGQRITHLGHHAKKLIAACLMAQAFSFSAIAVDAVAIAQPNFLFPGFAHGAVGYTFTPRTNLTVTRVGYLVDSIGVTNRVCFWSSTNQVIATYQFAPGTGSENMIFSNATLPLIAGHKYSITVQNGELSAGNVLGLVGGSPSSFSISPWLTNIQCAFVDSTGVFSFRSSEFALGPNFSFEVSPPLSPPPKYASGHFQWGVTGVPGANYVIQASTNLIDWIPLQTNFVPFVFVDYAAAAFSKRFYRALPHE